MPSTTLIAIQDICAGHRIEREYLLSLHDFGLIHIREEQYIVDEELPRLEKVIRLQHELGVNLEGVDIILRLLERIEQLESRY